MSRFVCTACGKTSPTREPGPDSDKGWDESCMLNCVECRKATEEEWPLKWIALEGDDDDPLP